MANNSLDIYLQALNSANSGIIITDNMQPDNPIIYCNRAFEMITGYSKEEVIGHNCRFLQAQDRSQRERKQLKESIQLGEECRANITSHQ